MTPKLLSRLLVAIILILPSALSAQSSISTTTCPGSGCVVIPVGGQGTVGIQLTGTWVGTIAFKGSLDNTNFVTLLVLPSGSSTAVSTTTGNGVWTASVAGLSVVQVSFSAYTSGTAVVSSRTTPVSKSGGTAGGGGSGGTVTSVDTSGPLSGGPFTTSGTIACTTCGVTTSPLSQFAATTSAQLAGVISNETGSGSLVFATSPTLTTPTIGAATVTSLNGLAFPGSDGTANQVLTTDGAGTISFQPVVSSTTIIINNIKFQNGKGLTTDIHTNDTLVFQAYDVDDTVYRTFATLTAGNVPNFDIASPTGGTLSFTLGSDATGDIFYRNSSGKVARLGIGSSANVLTVAAGIPSWAPPAASGGSIESHTASSSSSLDFTSCFSGTYENYRFELSGIVAATANANLYAQMGTGGGPTWDVTGADYQRAIHYYSTAGSSSHSSAGSGSDIKGFLLAGPLSTTAQYVTTGWLELYSPATSTIHRNLKGSFQFYHNGDTNRYDLDSNGWYVTTAAAVTGVRFIMDSGNITSGTIRCYGIPN